MYTFDRNILPSHIKDTFPGNGQIYISNHSPRNTLNYCLPKCILQFFKSSFTPTAVSEWNALPMDVMYVKVIPFAF